MSWCPWICRPWPQHYPHMADEVTGQPALQTIQTLGGIDDNVPVTLTAGVQLPSTVRTVGDLRRLTAWPTKHRLVVERAPFVEVRVELGRAVHHA